VDSQPADQQDHGMDLAELDLQAAMPILAAHKGALAVVREHFRGDDFHQAVRMRTAGRFDGEVGAELTTCWPTPS
jgi:hypothetical protein